MKRTRIIARSVCRATGGALLTLLSMLGVSCILGVLVAWIWGYSIVLFSTGSMAPTITAGSAALVREIPASEVRVGDVVTVARPNLLPVTHRVRAIEPGPDDQRVLTLRGDANASDDGVPYRVDTVRRVVFSVPGIAALIHQLGEPLVLGAASVVMALFVGWVFWPRAPSSNDEDTPPTMVGDGPVDHPDPERDPGPDVDPDRGTAAARSSGTNRAGGAAAVVLLGALTFAAVSPVEQASAAVTEQVHSGRYLTLVAVGDADAMHALAPGVPVDWQVGVSIAAPEPGRVTVTMVVSGVSGDIRLAVALCAERWVAGACSTGARTVLARTAAGDLAGTVVLLDSLPTDRRTWVRIRAEIPAVVDSRTTRGTASVRVRAQAFGDQVDSGGVPIGSLPNTGVPAGTVTAVAFATIVAGALLLGVIERRRRMTS